MAKKKDSNRSLTFVIIVMAIICIFVGYLVGINLFRWMKKGSEPQIAKTENQTENTPTEVTSKQEKNEKDEQKQEATTQNESDVKTDTEVNVVEENPTKQDQADQDKYENIYKIQVGAFSNRKNAESFKDELVNQGYNVIIREASTFKVRVVGKSSREETQEIEDQLIELGYDTFIVK